MTWRNLFLLENVVLFLSLLVCCPNSSLAQANISDQAFLGRWDLTLQTPQREAPSRLEITQAAGSFMRE